MNDFFLDNTLYNGRPADAGRPEKELHCYDLLDELSIEYQRADHSPAQSVADCEKVGRLIGVNIYKNLFLCNRQKTHFYLLVMPALKPFRTSVFSKLIGSSRLSFADKENMEMFLNLTPGSVSILGLMYDKNMNVRLVIDKDIVDAEYFRCHPCINTSTIKIKTSNVMDKLLPAIGHEPIIAEMPWDADSISE